MIKFERLPADIKLRLDGVKEILKILRGNGIIDSKLFDTMEKMAEFRNILVH